MEILLNLSRHCIETQAKKVYEQELGRYFKAGPENRPLLEERIGLLKNFLEKVDFGDLRSRHPALSGGSQQTAALVADSGKSGFLVKVAGLDFTPLEKKARL
ncbi:MAG: hypothetical protein QMD09_12560 [Desulfatibacillaceae bacterium]|nr:hypothetical protein [Desulfatibacillaceae bacterium]